MAIRGLMLALALAAGPAPMNEIVAVVEGTPITLWDLDVETRLRGLEQRGLAPEGDLADTERVRSLEFLINQMLALRAADRYNVPQPGEGFIDDEMRDLRLRAVLPLGEQLARAGIPESRLRDRARAKLRISRLVDQRLKQLVRVSDEEVGAYLKQHGTTETASTETVRQYLAVQTLQERSRLFFTDLRARATVDILDPRFKPAPR